MEIQPLTDDAPLWGVSLEIWQYSHGFEISLKDKKAMDATLSYIKQFLAQYGLVRVAPNRFTKAMTKVYVGVTKDRSYFYLPINLMEHYLNFLSQNGISKSEVKKHRLPSYEPAPLSLTYHDTREALEYQKPIIDYILESGNTKLVTLEPGQGKTFIALSAMRYLNMRTFICIKPMYIEKWIGDIQEAFAVEKEDILVIKGRKAMIDLMTLAQLGTLTAKVIICSNKTYFNYLKAYERYGPNLPLEGYPFYPFQLFEKLAVGLRIVDEVHQDWHFNARLYLYSHVPKTLALSGTLVSDDPTVNQTYEAIFPQDIRFNVEKHKPYVTVECWVYRCPGGEDRVKYMNHAMKSYSHIRFEQSVMRQKQIFKAYTGMILDIIETRYLARKQPGQKLVVYTSTVDLATRLSEMITELCPDHVVDRYVSEDDYEEMLGSDIVVSTLKSLGTAHDIPDLWMVLMTDAIGSRQANLQAMGRLRKLKRWPDCSPEFLYLTCQDIDKHLHYHQKKRDYFRGRVLSHEEIKTDYTL